MVPLHGVYCTQRKRVICTYLESIKPEWKMNGKWKMQPLFYTKNVFFLNATRKNTIKPSERIFAQFSAGEIKNGTHTFGWGFQKKKKEILFGGNRFAFFKKQKDATKIDDTYSFSCEFLALEKQKCKKNEKERKSVCMCVWEKRATSREVNNFETFSESKCIKKPGKKIKIKGKTGNRTRK